MRHKSMVRATFSGLLEKPGAKIFTMVGINISNKTMKIIRMNVKNDTAFAANRIDSSFPEDTNFEENNGTNAAVKAPSAKRLLKRFGNLNDTRNASDIFPAPKKLAISISRINPVMRLIIVKPPKVAMDLIKDIGCFLVKKFLKMDCNIKSVNKGQIICRL